MGSILDTEAAAGGRNFITEAAEASFDARRSIGWGVDAPRTQGHMTSSQALMFNLFGTLAARRGWLEETLSLVVGLDPHARIRRLEFEYSPRPLMLHLNDRTLVDVMLWVETADGHELLVFEVKLADRFSSRKVRFDQNERYAELSDSTGVWRAPLSALVDSRSNQLTRVHALALKVAVNDRIDLSRCRLVVLHHPTDHATPRTVAAYSELVDAPERIVDVDLAAFVTAVGAAAHGPGEVSAAQELAARYVELELSETANDRLRSRSAVAP